jgi:hypothetical protein
MRVKHAFVETIPETIEAGTLYVSIPYATAVHACLCGCGEEVVTPLSPVDWALTFDGETVSLSPSIGSWSLPCQSHYWLRRSQVVWAERWDKREIERGREWTGGRKKAHFDGTAISLEEQATEHIGRLARWRRRLRQWIG